MSLESMIKSLERNQQVVAYRPPQAYGIAAIVNLFLIVGGPVLITGLFFYANTAIDAAAGGTTMAIEICNVDADSNVPTAVPCPAGGSCVWPLQGANPPVPTAANFGANPLPTLAAAGAGSFGQLATPGSAVDDWINLEVLTAATVGQCSWYVIYRRMNEWAEIIVV